MQEQGGGVGHVCANNLLFFGCAEHYAYVRVLEIHLPDVVVHPGHIVSI